MKVKNKKHMRGEWGVTLCGREGWNNHLWSSWEESDSIKSTFYKKDVTCKTCLKIISKHTIK